MSTAGWLAAVALVAVGVLGVMLPVTLRRTRAVEARLRRLEARVTNEVEPAIEAATTDARVAGQRARDAAAQVGLAEPAPRLPLEPVTGPIVRAVALGAGAGRVLTRL